MSTIYEWCPYCENEVALVSEFKKQRCPECDVDIIPCSLCYEFSCEECPMPNIK